MQLKLDMPAVVDVCCGPRMMWFEASDGRALFLDKRQAMIPGDRGTVKTRGRVDRFVAPDVLADFTKLPFADNSFHLVAFDPPHMLQYRAGAAGKGILPSVYGTLRSGWPEQLRGGFAECFRVLKPNGVLVFKWSEVNIPVSQILLATPHKPLFGDRRGKHTHWITFMKPRP